MSAATTSQRLDSRDAKSIAYPVAASTIILAGILLAMDGSGNLVNATEAAARRIVGWSETPVDNSAGLAGALTCNVRSGCVLLGNSGTNAVTHAHVGHACFLEDNQTVASVAGSNSVVVGKVLHVDSDGVWVLVGAQFTEQPQAITALAALTSTNGTAGAAADLTALKAEAEKIGDDTRAVWATLTDVITALKANGTIK